jgi:hypothetical protein
VSAVDPKQTFGVASLAHLPSGVPLIVVSSDADQTSKLKTPREDAAEGNQVSFAEHLPRAQYGTQLEDGDQQNVRFRS